VLRISYNAQCEWVARLHFQVINTYADKQAAEGVASDVDDDDDLCEEETVTEADESINETDLLVELEEDLDNVVCK